MNRQRLIAWIHAEIAANGAGSVFLNRGLDPDTGDYEAGEIADEIEQGHFPEVLQVMNAERGEDSMSYTPGPWGFSGDTLRGDDMRRIIAYGVEDRDKPILAAAPALVDALRDMLIVHGRALHMTRGYSVRTVGCECNVCANARAALAAAGVEVDA